MIKLHKLLILSIRCCYRLLLRANGRLVLILVTPLGLGLPLSLTGYGGNHMTTWLPDVWPRDQLRCKSQIKSLIMMPQLLQHHHVRN